ncbi:hypothetical protein QZH41_003073, partial [Actinostola sp. cb2023]
MRTRRGFQYLKKFVACVPICNLEVQTIKAFLRAKKYKETIDGYVAKGYARKLTSEETVARPLKQWFLPHHPVLNPNKPYWE